MSEVLKNVSISSDSSRVNFTADSINSTGELWDSVYGGYFSNNTPLERFWEIVRDTVLINKDTVSIVELGSANANLCKFVIHKILETLPDLKINSYAVDTQIESIEIIQEKSIQKITADIANWNPKVAFDIVLMRSVLHYNDIEKQIMIFKNISNIMSNPGIFFNQSISGNEAEIFLYKKIQSIVFEREVSILTEEEYLNMANKFFKQVRKIGDSTPMKITARDMLDRFSKNEKQRHEKWKKLQNVTNWNSEDDFIIMKYPVFEHRN